jgi:hypothetical protein
MHYGCKESQDRNMIENALKRHAMNNLILAKIDTFLLNCHLSQKLKLIKKDKFNHLISTLTLFSSFFFLVSLTCAKIKCRAQVIESITILDS